LLCIIGIGGFGRETLCCFIDILNNPNAKLEELVCFMVDDDEYKEKELKGIPIYPLSQLDTKKHKVVVAVGNPIVRENIIKRLPANTIYSTLIHPSATVSKWVVIGKGSIVCAGSVITTDVKIGNHAHINLNTTIGHDCEIGDFFTSAPSVNISGICRIGDKVYFGSGSCIKQQVSICSNVIIGMGGIVIKDINVSGTYVGNPVKKIEK